MKNFDSYNFWGVEPIFVQFLTKLLLYRFSVGAVFMRFQYLTLSALKKIPPIQIPSAKDWNNLALKRTGFFMIFMKSLLSKVLKMVN